MVTAVYIDYSKAFDTVSHVKLFQKLSAFGIGGNLLAWIKALLTGRTQRTRVGNSLSDSVKLGNSGVIQNSYCTLTMLHLLFLANANVNYTPTTLSYILKLLLNMTVTRLTELKLGLTYGSLRCR